MIITLELLNARKAEAIDRRDKALASVNAATGALNAIDHLIALLDLPEPPAKPTTPPKGELKGPLSPS